MVKLPKGERCSISRRRRMNSCAARVRGDEGELPPACRKASGPQLELAEGNVDHAPLFRSGVSARGRISSRQRASRAFELNPGAPGGVRCIAQVCTGGGEARVRPRRTRRSGSVRPRTRRVDTERDGQESLSTRSGSSGRSQVGTGSSRAARRGNSAFERPWQLVASLRRG